MYGPERLINDLRQLGFSDLELVRTGNGSSFAVILGYQILLGQFAGRVIDLGIPATADFPRSVGSSIHVKANPQLLEKHNTIPGVRNIIDSALGQEWRYWSKNFGWAGERSARRLISQINEVFKNA
jgi:hypothetical protein